MTECYITEKVCAICNKLIYPTPQWVYKLQDKRTQRLNWYCSYKCWRKGGGGSGGREIDFSKY